MKIITRGVIDWATLAVLEEESYEYDGPMALAKDSGSPPQPVDPYQQAAAQYGLSTGTAEFNAALNRPNIQNPLGSTSWSVGGYSGQPGTQQPNSPAGYGLGGSGVPIAPSSGTPPPMATAGQGMPTNPNGSFGLPTGAPLSPQQQIGQNALADIYGGGSPAFGLGGPSVGTGAPLYTETTHLAPQFESLLQQGINTNGIPQLSGENLTPLTNETQNAVFQQNMGYLAPEEALQSEGLNSQLAAEGAMPGSAAWNTEQGRLGRQQTFENTQAASGAVTAGEQELNNLYGLGAQSEQAQIAQQQAPINEFNALQGGAGAAATAQTPDISGAFGQQYQGALAGYNAQTASNNQTTQDAASLGMMALMFASDEKLKTDIRKVGTLPSGPNIYQFRYKGKPDKELGLVAQDVEKTHPEAVFNLGGTKYVNYGGV